MIVQTMPVRLRALEWGQRHPRRRPIVLPVGYVVPKQGKTARTIVDCSATVLAPLHAGAARVLTVLLDTVGDSWSLQSSMEFRDKVDVFNAECENSSADSVMILNEDAVQFFLTPSHESVKAGVSDLVDMAYNGARIADYGKRLFAFFGPSAPVTIGVRRESELQTRSIEIKLLQDLTCHALESQYLRVGGDCLVQAQGVLIGSHLGPPLCSIALARSERAWNRSLRALPVKSLPMCVGRYVDNRLTLVATHGGNTPVLASHFFDPLFYPPPVLFEPEPGYDALGATLRPRRGRSGVAVEMIPLVTGFDHVWSFLSMGTFPPPHAPCLARYQSWHTYCSLASFNGWWVGRFIFAIDSMTRGVQVAAVLAKLVLVLAASILCHVSPDNLPVVRDTFAMLKRALRSAGRSRPRVSDQCNFLARSITRCKRYNSAFACVQQFLATPCVEGGNLKHAIAQLNV